MSRGRPNYRMYILLFASHGVTGKISKCILSLPQWCSLSHFFAQTPRLVCTVLVSEGVPNGGASTPFVPSTLHLARSEEYRRKGRGIVGGGGGGQGNQQVLGRETNTSSLQ